MSEHIEAFDTTVHKTNAWLSEIMLNMGWDSRHKAWMGLRAVLHELRDRLTVEEMASLGAQLPMLVRGMYFEGWHPRHERSRARKKEAFLARVAAAFPEDPELDPEDLVHVVFGVVSRHISAGEARHLERVLPREIADMWNYAEAI